MKVKLAITGVILIVGVIVFLPQTMDLIPNPPTVIDSVKEDLSGIQEDTIEQVEGTIETSIDSVNSRINDFTESSQEFLSTQVAPKKIIPIEYEEKTFFGKLQEEETTQEQVERHGSSSGSVSSTKGGAIAIPTVITTPETQTISFETLSLVTEKQIDDTVSLKYEDTSGQTISVTVTMRNDDKILFTGQFFSSSFETIVLDAADTSHFIDMIVEHEVHGTISASAFNPAGNTDSMITGAFTSG
ncbi:MAG: hypothetical protein ACE5RJ_00305 [Nitrosopumilaceae archaeon]